MIQAALLFSAIAAFVIGTLSAVIFELRRRNLSWQWLLPAGLLGLLLWPISGGFAVTYLIIWALVVCVAARWHNHDVTIGGIYAERAKARKRPIDFWRERALRAPLESGRLIEEDALIVGINAAGFPMRVPYNSRKGYHGLVLGKTGYGKSVTMAYLAAQSIRDGKAAIVVDPKGDANLRRALKTAADAAGKRFIEWTTDGPSIFNPYKYGSPTEIADKVLSAENYTEPHYLRQAQRYLGWQLRAMHLAGEPANPDSLVHYMYSANLLKLAPRMDDSNADRMRQYLHGLSTREETELSGTRNRLAILAESDIGPWISPRDGFPELDLREVVARGHVAYIRLDSDRFPEASKMLGAAIVSDLVSIVAELQRRELTCPTLVILDEFHAVAAHEVVHIFGRARQPGISIVLGTQSLADFKAIDDADALVDQVIDNVSSITCHLQSVPDSAERLAEIAGTEEIWTTTMRTSSVIASLPTGDGTRTRDRAFVLHPDQIKSLEVGQAALITYGIKQRPEVTSMFMPDRAMGPIPA